MAIDEGLREEIIRSAMLEKQNETLLQVMTDVVTQCGVEDVLSLADYNLSIVEGGIRLEPHEKDDDAGVELEA